MFQKAANRIAFSAGSTEKVDELTTRLKKDGFEVVSGPRTTGDNYYESCIVVIEGNQIEITEYDQSFQGATEGIFRMSGIILYKSKYGATRKYAEWLSERTGFSYIETEKSDIGVISGYDVIILGGGIYETTEKVK